MVLKAPLALVSFIAILLLLYPVIAKDGFSSFTRSYEAPPASSFSGEKETTDWRALIAEK